MLVREDVEAKDIQRVLEELKVGVVKPAIALMAMLRKRYTPIVIGTPLTIDSTIRKWARPRMECSKAETSGLDIVVVPEMLRIDLEADPDGGQYQVLVEAQMYTMIDVTGEDAMEEGEVGGVTKVADDP